MGMISTRQGRALGSAIDLQIANDDSTSTADAEVALDDALAAIEAAEACLSRFRPTSELCALNRAAGDWFAASDVLFAIVQDALAWARRTGGLFDPTILRTLEDLGYDRDFTAIQAGKASRSTTTQGQGDVATDGEDLLVSTRGMPAAATLGGYQQVRLDPAGQRIWLPVGMGIDLGGIGKGWIADEVSERVLGHLPNVLVNLGGDLRVRGGPAPGEGWIIAARDPRQEDAPAPVYLGGVELRAGGIATSGAAWRWWRQAGVPVHHLVDPRTGRSAAQVSITGGDDRVLAATALAATATAAEVLAKYALLLGLTNGLRMLDHGSEHAGWFIMGSGRIVPSTNLGEYLGMHG